MTSVSPHGMSQTSKGRRLYLRRSRAFLFEAVNVGSHRLNALSSCTCVVFTRQASLNPYIGGWHNELLLLRGLIILRQYIVQLKFGSM